MRHRPRGRLPFGKALQGPLKKLAIPLPAGLRRFARRLWWLGWLALIAALVWSAYWVGIRTTGPPQNLHSLGVVATVQNGTGRSGLNVPSGGRCAVCANGSDLMRFNPGAGLRVDLVVSVHPKLLSCGQAVVDMVISGTPAFWQQHNRLGPGTLTEIAVGWDRFTHVRLPPGVVQPPAARGAPALTVFYDDPQAPLHPGFYLNSDLLHNVGDRHQTKVAAFPQTNPYGVRTRIYNWDFFRSGSGITFHRWPLHLHFIANWVVSRGLGSCYVLLPSFLANGAFAGTEDAVDALERNRNAAQPTLLDQAQPPVAGRTALATTGSFSLSDTNPPPTDMEAVFFATHGSPQQRAAQFVTESGGRLGPVWACDPTADLSYLAGKGAQAIPATGSFAGDACGAVAVVNAPGVADFRAVFLIVIGVLIALAVERFVDSVRPEPKDT